MKYKIGDVILFTYSARKSEFAIGIIENILSNVNSIYSIAHIASTIWEAEQEYSKRSGDPPGQELTYHSYLYTDNNSFKFSGTEEAWGCKLSSLYEQKQKEVLMINIIET